MLCSPLNIERLLRVFWAAVILQIFLALLFARDARSHLDLFFLVLQEGLDRRVVAIALVGACASE